jgi:4-carboxymuconolactone decarboxylase
MPTENQLGGRLPLLDADTLDTEQRQLVDYLMSTFVPWSNTTGFDSRTPDGRFIGPFNALLRSPAVAGPFLQFQISEGHHTSLGGVLVGWLQAGRRSPFIHRQ